MNTAAGPATARPNTRAQNSKENRYAFLGRNLFVIALIAAVLGFSGIAGTAVNIAWAQAVIGIILTLIFMVMGRRPSL